MNIIFVCQRFYKTNPTSLCVWAVVKKLVELGHKCRIVTASGVVFDSCKSNELKNSSDLEPEKNVGRVKRVFNYISFYRTWPYEGEMFNENLYQQTKSEIDKLTPDVIITPYNYLDSVVVKRTKTVPDVPEDTKVSQSADNSLIFNETNRQLFSIVSRMPEQRQLVFRMSRYENLSNQEISERLGLSVRTVEKHLQLALRDIRSSMN